MIDRLAHPESAIAEAMFVFLGDTETARLARSTNWAETALGPLEKWPASLKTSAGLVIAAGYPTILLWGPALTQIYNNAYRELMGGKHPAGMGQPTRNCWPEVWEINEPIYERVRAGETLTFHNRLFPIVRYGYLEDAYFTLCYSPVRDESHAVAGVLVTVFETTEQITSDADRIKAEKELIKSEERLNFALEGGGGVGDWNWDIPNDRFYCNARFADLFSVDPKRAAAGAPLSEFMKGIHSEDRSWVGEAIQKAINDGGAYSEEYRLQNEEGTVRWVCARGRCYRDPSGAPLRFPGVVFDITHLKTAESERRRSEELLQMVIDNVPGLVSYIDCDSRYRFANKQYRDWYGNDPLIGQTVSDVLGEEAYSRAKAYLDRALGGEPVRFEQAVDYQNSYTRHVQVAYTPERDEEGMVRGVVAMVQDITAAKEIQQALHTSEQQLQQSFEQAPVAVAVLRGRDMVFELANACYQQFFPGRPLVGLPLHEALPELGGDLLQILHGVLDTGEPFVGYEYLVPLERDHDGSLQDSWFTFSYQPLREPTGAVTGIVVVAVEVTNHVQARQGLEKANRTLEEFAYVASHDIQESLRMIGIYSELLLKEFASGDTTSKTYAAFIRQGVDRMHAQIRDLLTYSQAVKAHDGEIGVASLSASLAQALSVLKGQIEESGAVITADALPKVAGDTDQLSHVFQNLISNALKYRALSRRPEILISARRKGDLWTIEVRDNGIGFEQKYATQIFGLFKRLHTQEYPGTGLGLAICQRVIERYRGRIWAESSPGAGAAFFFTLFS